jgi:hypothetical protein
LPAGFKEYEDGKHRRYELLLKVNGAAFAIAALAFKTDTKAFIENVICLSTLAVGMALFTIVMAVDIPKFGRRMKQLDPRIKKSQLPFAPRLGEVTPHNKGLFRPVGMGILAAIVILTAVGWVLVAVKGVGR